MQVLRGIAWCVIGTGVAIASLGIELCSHGCLLEVMGDALLPAPLESMSGGIPLVMIGLLLWMASPRR